MPNKVASTVNETNDIIFDAISGPSGCGVCIKFGEVAPIKKKRKKREGKQKHAVVRPC